MHTVLITRARIATMAVAEPAYGLIDSGAVYLANGRIQWVGPMADLPSAYLKSARTVVDAQHRLVTPGLVDCHTHLVYAGNRANEFEWRLTGVTYEEISRRGGGIRSTVHSTRSASADQLISESLPRLKALYSEGVTTVEIKSGYGLDFATEIRMLETARALGSHVPARIVLTFLGAHAVPVEFGDRPDAYVEFLIQNVLPVVAERKLAQSVDVFVETIGFSLDQARMLYDSARKLGLPVRAHAGQLSDMGAVELACEYGALSCDHLEYVNEEAVCRMAASGAVAVLLPGAFYFLRETHRPPIDLFRRYGIRMAVATDCNPGTSPVTSLRLMMNMACTLSGLTPEEALAGVTIHAARALAFEDQIGSISPGKIADLVIWETDEPCQLAYQMGGIFPYHILRNGMIDPPSDPSNGKTGI